MDINTVSGRVTGAEGNVQSWVKKKRVQLPGIFIKGVSKILSVKTGVVDP